MDKRRKIYLYFLFVLLVFYLVLAVFYFVWEILLNIPRILPFSMSVVLGVLLLVIWTDVFIMMKRKIIPVMGEYPGKVFTDKILPVLIKAVCVTGVFSVIISLIRANL